MLRHGRAASGRVDVAHAGGARRVEHFVAAALHGRERSIVAKIRGAAGGDVLPAGPERQARGRSASLADRLNRGGETRS